MTDKFLGVGGTDGTNARPLKMDVEGNLEVKDVVVKAELESIKNQQAEILDKLNGTINTQLTGSNVEFRELIIRNDETILAGANEYTDVYSNPGEIWTIVRFGFEVGSTRESEGDHELALFHGTGASDANWIAQFRQSSTSYLRGVVPGRFTQYSESSPEVGLNLTEAIKNTTILSDVLPFRIRVRNLSDTDMTNVRTFRLFYKVEKVGN